MDLSGLMGMSDILDPASLGLDAAKVLAVNEWTSRIKEWLDECHWDDKFARFYFLIPFAAAAALCFLGSGFSLNMEFAKCTTMYGLWATFVWRGWKVGVRNE